MSNLQDVDVTKMTPEELRSIAMLLYEFKISKNSGMEAAKEIVYEVLRLVLENGVPHAGYIHDERINVMLHCPICDNDE